ncbi:MAG: tetratricopeptide repeat protein, partial [Zetaproteobacteria bacterium]|nr:tetratricopeptide repeat protein [Zetaproteobacteria bacterium]
MKFLSSLSNKQLCLLLFCTVTSLKVPLLTATADSFEQGVKFYDQENYAAAETSFYQLYQEQPNHSAALYNLSNVLYRSGQYAKSLAALLKAQQIDPRNRDISKNILHNLQQLQLQQHPNDLLQQSWQSTLYHNLSVLTTQ